MIEDAGHNLCSNPKNEKPKSATRISWLWEADWKTKRAVILFSALVAFGGIITPIFKRSAQPTVYDQAKAGSMYVECGEASGSGVVVERLSNSGRRVFIWTAAHVVDGDPLKVQAKIFFRNSAGYRAGEGVFDATLLAMSLVDDLALYWVNVPDHLVEGIEFASVVPVPIGDEVFHVGNFMGEHFENSVTRGIVSQHNIGPNLPGWFWLNLDQLNVMVIPGGSGGGVFTDDGKVVGLMVAGVSPTVSAMVPVRTIVDFAKAYALEWAIYGGICPSDPFLLELARVAQAELELNEISLSPSE